MESRLSRTFFCLPYFTIQYKVVSQKIWGQNILQTEDDCKYETCKAIVVLTHVAEQSMGQLGSIVSTSGDWRQGLGTSWCGDRRFTLDHKFTFKTMVHAAKPISVKVEEPFETILRAPLLARREGNRLPTDLLVVLNNLFEKVTRQNAIAGRDFWGHLKEHSESVLYCSLFLGST